MFRPVGGQQLDLSGFPRIRGDVPARGFAGLPGETFSPHTRGCSGGLSTGLGLSPVFPAYAGMFLHLIALIRVGSGFPRIRGDVPR